jgi:hypothetical protein
MQGVYNLIEYFFEESSVASSTGRLLRNTDVHVRGLVIRITAEIACALLSLTSYVAPG